MRNFLPSCVGQWRAALAKHSLDTLAPLASVAQLRPEKENPRIYLLIERARYEALAAGDSAHSPRRYENQLLRALPDRQGIGPSRDPDFDMEFKGCCIEEGMIPIMRS